MPIAEEFFQLLRRCADGELNNLSLSLPLQGEILALAEQHSLSGYIYSRGLTCLPNEFKQRFESKWKAQSLYNTLLLNECERIEKLAASLGLQLVRLKGAAFLEDLYQNPGERTLSDIDFLIEDDQYQTACRFLIDQGYVEYKQVKWSANRFKCNFTKFLSEEVELSIDLHSQLVWRQSGYLRAIASTQFNGKNWRLGREEELLHTIINWSYQDTFISINKMLDIRQYVVQFKSDINWVKFNKLIRQSSYQRSVELTFYAIDKNLPVNGLNFMDLISPSTARGAFFGSLLDKNFLLKKSSHPIKHLLLKHLTKVNLVEALKYDFLWLRAYSLPWLRYFWQRVTGSRYGKG